MSRLLTATTSMSSAKPFASLAPRPHLVFLRTVKGHGVDFMADRMEWHYLPMTEEQTDPPSQAWRRIMRAQFCGSMVARARRPNMAFLTGDLGFMALEPLQRRSDAGSSTLASPSRICSLSRPPCAKPAEVWVYTIAPFCYARAFEQIRNDICSAWAAGEIVGNGGGYGYGVMGPTHHAIEDYGVMLDSARDARLRAGLHEDVAAVVARRGNGRPTYHAARSRRVPAATSLRPLRPGGVWPRGDGPVVVAVGAAGRLLSRDVPRSNPRTVGRSFGPSPCCRSRIFRRRRFVSGEPHRSRIGCWSPRNMCAVAASAPSWRFGWPSGARPQSAPPTLRDSPSLRTLRLASLHAADVGLGSRLLFRRPSRPSEPSQFARCADRRPLESRCRRYPTTSRSWRARSS